MDFLEAFSIIPRSLFSLLTLFFITKIMGKKQVSQLSLFDYVIGISIGNFAAEISINVSTQYINGIIAIIVFGLSAYLVSIITLKSVKLRKFFIGVPTIIIQNGKIIKKNMRKQLIDVNDLLEQCRTNGTFDISEIEYALMEANGKISIMLKSEYSPLTPNDMNIKVKKKGLCSNLIIDGIIMKSNLVNMNKDEKWLNKQVKESGNNLDDILLCTLDIDGKIIFYKKNEYLKLNDVLE